MHETELAVRLGVSLHRRTPVSANVDHRNSIDDALIILRVCVECFDHEPLIWMCITHLCPAHTSRVGTESDSEQLLGGESAGKRDMH